MEKKLDGNYTRMLRAILNKSWQQHSTRHQLYGHLPSITKTIPARRIRHPGHGWRSKDELISDVLLWTAAYGREKQDDQLEHTYSSYVRIRDVALKTSQRWWGIRRSGEKGSVISVLTARHDDDDDDFAIKSTMGRKFQKWKRKVKENARPKKFMVKKSTPKRKRKKNT